MLPLGNAVSPPHQEQRERPSEQPTTEPASQTTQATRPPKPLRTRTISEYGCRRTDITSGTLGRGRSRGAVDREPNVPEIVASITQGHWAVIGRRPTKAPGDRFYVKQAPFELEPDEIEIADRYLQQAVKSVQRVPTSNKVSASPEGKAAIEGLRAGATRGHALEQITTALIEVMQTRGRPNPGIVFALQVRLPNDSETVAVIKADLNQKQMAQLEESRDEHGRVRLRDARDVIDEPQSEFAKVLFSPSPHDAKLKYSISDRKVGTAHAASYFLEALGVRSTATEGTLKQVVAAVANAAQPPVRATVVRKVLNAVDARRQEQPDQPVPLEHLENQVPEAADTLRKLRDEGAVRTASVGAADRVTRTWKLGDPRFEMTADTRLVIEGPVQRGNKWIMTVELPAEPTSDW